MTEPSPARRTRLRWILIVSTAIAVVGGGGFLVWLERWHISRRAIEMADPLVRRWAEKEVNRLSHGAYHLTSSTIVVDEARRRVSVTSIRMVTDSVKARSAPVPLPIVVLEFHNCALTGIDLTRLAAGRGLHIAHGGCESVGILANVTATKGAADSTARPDSTTFLTLTKNLQLPHQIPEIAIDTIAFPDVSLGLEIHSGPSRRTNVALQRLYVRFDSMLYDRSQPASARRTLLSRNAVVTLDHFSGSREASSRLDIEHLALDLSARTAQLDGFVFEPLPGRRTDSLGFAAIDVRHLRMTGVDWRSLLTNGDVRVHGVEIDTGSVKVLPPRVAGPDEHGLAFPAPTLETSLRAIDRRVAVDTLAARKLLVTTSGTKSKSEIRVGELSLARVDFSPDDANWAGAFPIGRLSLTANDISRQVGTDVSRIAQLGIDLPADQVHASGLRTGPTGTDADFLRRATVQHDRVVLAVDSVRVIGADFREFIRRGRYQVRRTEVNGFSADILVDHGLPEDSTHRRSHRTPQRTLRDAGIDYRLDTIEIHGKITLRERSADAPEPGVLSLDSIRARVVNLTNDAARMTDSTPARLLLDARFMHAGTFHLEGSMPLLARDFRMRWKAEVGALPAPAFNPFLINATGMKFTGGGINQVRMSANVVNGRARGTIEPRWHGLAVEFPGMSRNDHGLFAGIKRGIAKFAANAFAVRDDNMAMPDKPPPLDATIDHQWSSRETLLSFLWLSIRDPLMPLLKH